MKPKLSPAYIDALFARRDYENLVEISSLLGSSESFNPSVSNYGLPDKLFLFCESLAWFAQSIRSGVWTYFEATPHDRQALALSVLEAEAPAGFADQYSFGIANWKDQTAMQVLDRWIGEHDEENNQWLWRLAEGYREAFVRVVA